jgi:hypothetical protein
MTFDSHFYSNRIIFWLLNYSCETSEIVTDNIYLATKQTPLANRHGQINTINKNNTYKDKKKHKLDKTPTIDSPTKDSKKKEIKEKNKKPICHKCKKIGHYQNNCVSNKNWRNCKN